MIEASLNESSAVILAAAMRSGKVSAEEVTAGCLARIEAREGTVRAFAYLDPDAALAQARAADARRAQGAPLGSLHGVPVAVKDIFDTGDMPTECGSAFHRGRQPTDDARVVALLREAGAVILGKAVTAEMALTAPGPTRNPHDPDRTPGGSSSGSAAAVADAMAPLAIGSQTGGSMIRPAAFCGVVGYKPTFGSISRAGMHPLARCLDHVGVFARSLADVAACADVLMVPDRADPDVRDHPGADLAAALAGDSEPRPRLAFVRGAPWDEIEPGSAERLEALAARLDLPGAELPAALDDAVPSQRMVTAANLAASLGDICREHPDRLEAETRTRVEAGFGIGAEEYIRAVNAVPGRRAALAPLFERYDALVTAAAPGEAPLGLASTGSPAFCVTWTLLGMPAVSLPLLTGPAGLPIGVQVVGPHGEDARLFRAARWLAEA